MTHAIRPRLKEDALVRFHVVDGQPTVVLHDRASGALMRLGERERVVLSLTDGTRNVAELVREVAARGHRLSEANLGVFLEALDVAGLLIEGPAEPRIRAPERSDARALEALPGYAFHCDGRGGCCGIYPSLLFTTSEAARAQATCPAAADRVFGAENLFTAAEGAAHDGLRVVSSVNGACVFLNDNKRCGVHVAAGAKAKPRACDIFPTTFIDDGVSVRVSVTPECRCVFSSRDAGALAEPLIAAGVRTRGDLIEAAFVTVLPRRVRWTPTRLGPREGLAEWSRAMVDAVSPNALDAAAAFLALSKVVAQHGDAIAPALEALDDATPPLATDVEPSITRLAARAVGRAEQDRTWRSPHDLSRRVVDRLVDACALLSSPRVLALCLAGPSQPSDEALYFRSILWGHHAWGARPLADAFRDAAIRVVVARAMYVLACASPAASDEVPFDHPLAPLEALLSGHGLSGYLDDAPADRSTP